MTRLGLLLFCMFMSGVLASQSKDSVVTIPQIDKTRKLVKEDEQKKMVEKEMNEEKDATWLLNINKIRVTPKKYKKPQIGFDKPDLPWSVVGRVVDTLGNPIEGVYVMRNFGNATFGGNPYTDSDGYYVVRNDVSYIIDDRVFKKKGYRVAGEKVPGTRTYLYHCYTKPNTIIMVPRDYTGDESKYEVGVERHGAPFGVTTISLHTYQTYYEFEEMSFFNYLKSFNFIDRTTDSTMSVLRNGINIRPNDEDIYDKDYQERQERRLLKKEQRKAQKKLNQQ